MVSMTSSGGVPRSWVMIENWSTSVGNERVSWENRRFGDVGDAGATYGLSRGIEVFLPASRQRYSLYSRYRQRHRIFAMLAWFLVHDNTVSRHNQSSADLGFERDRNHRSARAAVLAEVNRFEGSEFALRSQFSLTRMLLGFYIIIR